MIEGEAVESQVHAAVESYLNGRSDGATVVPLAPQRRLRGASLAPLIVRLKKVHLYSAQGTDRFRGYVSTIIRAIAESLDIAVTKVEPVALLVYRDLAKSGDFLNEKDYGNVVLLFQIDSECQDTTNTLCEQQRHTTWSQAWREIVSDPNSTIAEIFKDQVDEKFPHELTPALCRQWEIRGPGCSSTQHYSSRRGEEAEGLPLWFVMGVATMAVLMCALYPVSRIIKVQRRGRHLPRAGGEAVAEAVKPDLSKLKREVVSVSSLGEDATCPICLSKPADELTEEVLIAPCKHCMHVTCAEAWFAKHVQCPLCRSSFKADECVVWQLEEGVDVKRLKSEEGERTTHYGCDDEFGRACSLESGFTLASDEGTAPNVIGSPTSAIERENSREQSQGDELGNEPAADFDEGALQRDPLPASVSGNSSNPTVDTTMLPDPRSSLMRVAVSV